MSDFKISNKTGVYTLINKLVRDEVIKIGKFGLHFFPRGFYSYTGSALGTYSLSLRGRLSRHLSSKKKKRWHIDYLLDSKSTKVVATIYFETHLRMECFISERIENLTNVTSPVKRFGATDCHNNCQSHLHFFPNTS